MSDLTSAWNRRAETFELRALRNPREQTDPTQLVTDAQWDAIRNLMTAELRGSLQLALDFYCAAGHFTADLAVLIDGQALGIDTNLPSINEADAHDRVRFVHTPDGRVPTGSRTIDLVLVNHALGGLRGRLLGRAVSEITRVLKHDGLLVLIENTADEPDTLQRVCRTTAEYRKLFPTVALAAVDDPAVSMPRSTVMIGRMMTAHAE